MGNIDSISKLIEAAPDSREQSLDATGTFASWSASRGVQAVQSVSQSSAGLPEKLVGSSGLLTVL